MATSMHYNRLSTFSLCGSTGGESIWRSVLPNFRSEEFQAVGKNLAAGVTVTLERAETMSNGYFSRGRNNGTMIFWDLETVSPPPNFEFLDHLLSSHRALSTGLFNFRPPLRLRAHGTEALPPVAHDYIVKSTLCLQQSISCDTEEGSCWKAMIMDMLLWATDTAPGTADMVIISRVLDRSLADAIHQLHMRNYNIIVTTSFPPKSVPPLHEFVPPQIKLLHQIFSSSDFVWNGVRQRALIPLATSPTPTQQAFCNGASDSVRNGARQSASSIPPATSPTPRQSALIPLATAPTVAPRALYYGPLTMEEVRTWLEELVASGRANQSGINLSLLPKDFEERTGMKLNYKSLNYPNLITLISKFDNLVRLERSLTMVTVFPKYPLSTQGARPVVPAGSGPVSYRPSLRPPRKCIPEAPVRPCIVPASSSSGNVPVEIPGPKLSCAALRTTTMRMPTPPGTPPSSTTTMRMPTPPSSTVPASSSFVHLMPAADVSRPTAEVSVGFREAKVEQISPPPLGDIPPAPKPDSSPHISMAFQPPPDVPRDANTASEANLGGQHPLPTMASTSAIDEGHQPSNREENGMRFNDRKGRFKFYFPTESDEVKEKAKRVIESVTQRLREDYIKKRRLEKEQLEKEKLEKDAGASDQKNDMA